MSHWKVQRGVCSPPAAHFSPSLCTFERLTRSASVSEEGFHRCKPLCPSLLARQWCAGMLGHRRSTGGVGLAHHETY